MYGYFVTGDKGRGCPSERGRDAMWKEGCERVGGDGLSSTRGSRQIAQITDHRETNEA